MGDGIPTWDDDSSWTGEPMPVRIRDRFPQLAVVADLELESGALAAHRDQWDDVKTVRWLGERGGVARIGDLLDLTDDDILGWNHIGVGKRDKILGWLAGLALDVEQIISGPAGGPLAAYLRPPEPDRDLELLALWGKYAGHAATWGGTEPHLGDAVPDDVHAALERLRLRSLPDTPGLPDADDVLTAWVGQLEDRDRDVLRGRLVRSPQRTLHDIGEQHGVTRERIRQLERRLVDRIPQLLERDDWRAVRWEVFAVRRRFGAYAPLTGDEVTFLASAEGFSRSLVLWLARYERLDDRVQHEDFTLPALDDLPLVDPDLPIIDEAAARADLLESGVAPDLVGWTLDSVKGVGRVDGVPVLWPTNIVEKSYAVLAVRNKQMTPDELAVAIGGGISVRGLRQRLYEDDRLARTSRHHVGLVAWGGEQYTGAVGLMCARLESGPRVLPELAAELASEFGLSENSVLMYAAAPVFHLEGGVSGVVSLREPDNPYVPRARPEKVPGLYQSGTDELVWSVVADRDLLRGSGRALAAEVATFLGVQPGVRIELGNEVRDVPIGWLETSHTGGNIGSLKPHVEAIGAAEGDVVQVRVDRVAHTLSVALRPPAPSSDAIVDRLAWLTGLPAYVCSDREQLAAAVHVTPTDLEATLRSRGEEEAADLVAALPAAQPAG